MLTPKQERFVQEYIIDLNATAAAKRAGYSAHTAHSTGHDNVRKPEIAQAIADAQKARSERVQWTAEEILRDLRAIAEDTNNRLADRLRAYELGGKANGMFKEVVQHTGSVTQTVDFSTISTADLRVLAEAGRAENQLINRMN